MSHHGFNGFGHGSASIDPNDLAMSGGGGGGFGNQGFLSDEDLLSDINSGTGQQTMDGNQNFSGMDMGFSQDAYQAHRHSTGLRLDQAQVNGYSSTPDGDPVPSPYTTGFNPNFRQQMQSMHSPMYQTGMNNGESSYMNARAGMSQQMQRKPSNNPRSPMTPKTSAMHGLSIGSHDSPNFGPQSIRTVGSHDKSPSTQWLNTPNGSFPASYNSGFGSPLQGTMVPPIEEVIHKGGASMPAKLNMNNGSNSNGNPVSSQEAKRKRRRESHNLVERRRRDNINERIQDLSKLVPMHRLEDDKVRKLLQNGTPLSPTLTGVSNPSSATSGLAGPGARRATGGAAGNITTGLPVEDKDKGPNKGDILNGAVSWTRDLMWLLHIKLQQQDELINMLNELGQPCPFETTDDERRMQSELLDAMARNDVTNQNYTRTNGTGLRVPNYTDYRGSPVSGAPSANLDSVGITPPHNGESAIVDDLADTDQFWHAPNDGPNGHVSLDFKDEDDYGMELN